MPHPITIKVTNLGEDELRLYSLQDSCGLSVLGECHLSLSSPSKSLVPEDMLGKAAAVTAHPAHDDAQARYFHGYITSFGLDQPRGRETSYRAVLRPWLWFLTRTTDSRIFQELSVPDIVKKVFQDHRVANFEFKLYRQYRVRNYCVQYRESDFNFVARLLEQEGIYWYFKHTEDEHKLILCDSATSHDPIKDHGESGAVDYYAHPPVLVDVEYISPWRSLSEVSSGSVMLKDFDFERPSAVVDGQSTVQRKYELSDYELYDYPGDFLTRGDGRQYADNQIEEVQTRFQMFEGGTNVRALMTGYTFTLAEHPRDEQNGTYLITHTVVTAQNPEYESGGTLASYECRFGAITSDQQFRPQRRTPKPFVQGPQTAIVVGTDGEEIDTDKYGRVKVQFHWDRYGKRNEKSSCWVRVAQIWAGKNFGGIFIPRIGQEVIVDFLEGDPDQPIVTGRVYNAEQMPPWTLPEKKTQSGILTRSTKGGDYNKANEISFEDKAGAEVFKLHAERDMSRNVERDDSTAVGNDQSVTVARDQTTSVGRDQSLKVTRNRSIHVVKNEDTKIDVDQSLKVVGNQYSEIGGYQYTFVDGKHALNVKGDIATETKSNRADNTKGNESRTVGGNQIFNVTGTLSYKAATMIFEAGHIEHKVTGANSVVHTSPNGPYSIMANKFTVMSNTDASILAVGNINSTSMGNNTTVMGANSSGYMGSASDTKMGLSRSTFLGLNMQNTLGASISNTLALQFEGALAAKITCAAGCNVDMTSIKIYLPAGAAAAEGAVVMGEGATMLLGLAALEAVMAGFLTTIVGISEVTQQYSDAKAELREAAQAAADAGHPGLAARLSRLASGDDVASGNDAPTSTQFTRGDAFDSRDESSRVTPTASSTSSPPASTGTLSPTASPASPSEPNQSVDPGTSSEPNQSVDPGTSSEPNQSVDPGTSSEPNSSPAPASSSEPNSSPAPGASSEPNQSVDPNASFDDGSSGG